MRRREDQLAGDREREREIIAQERRMCEKKNVE